MYTESYDLYDKLYSFKDYGREAALIVELVKARAPSARSLLDVACGTGRHLQHLKDHFQAEGIDISPGFAAAARRNNPGMKFHVGDMVSFRLRKRYDVIMCLFSSIGYVRTRKNLASAIANLARHLTERGLLIVEPWFPPEAWHPNTAHALFVNEPQLKIARMSTSRTRGLVSVVEMHYLVATPRSTRHFSELHQMGLFTREEMMAAFRKAKLDTEYQDQGITGRGMYVACPVRPGGDATPS